MERRREGIDENTREQGSRRRKKGGMEEDVRMKGGRRRNNKKVEKRELKIREEKRKRDNMDNR